MTHRSEILYRENITLFHSHGIAGFDYSSITPDDLFMIDALARESRALVCPTVFLHRSQLKSFITLMEAYAKHRADGDLPQIVGFSLEGPLLGCQGGVPRGTQWAPTVNEWRDIAALGASGLRYIVMAPDALGLDESVGPGYLFADLLRDCYDRGLRIALGHFVARDSPERSAAAVVAVVEYLHLNYESSPYLVLTDHLFNDMPRNFVHAWRTREEQRGRAKHLADFLAIPWEPASMTDTLGPVPALLLNYARAGLLTPTLNFDGYHVDLAICKKTVDYLGSGRLIAITDHTEVDWLGGEHLHKKPGSPLLYRSDDVIAAGSSDYPDQIANMMKLGLSTDDITSMFRTVPMAALRYSPRLRS